MSVNPNQELIWQGRIHLGDEPGIFGDAHYSGLSARLPITIFRSDLTNLQDNAFQLVLETEGVKTFSGYPGHQITISIHEPDPSVPFHSIERILAKEKLETKDTDRKEITLKLGTVKGPFFLSISLLCDISVTPGLYNDFVWRRLSLISEDFTYFASFGFQNT